MSGPVSIKGLIQVASGVSRSLTLAHCSTQSSEDPKKHHALLFPLAAKEQYLELTCKFRAEVKGRAAAWLRVCERKVK